MTAPQASKPSSATSAKMMPLAQAQQQLLSTLAGAAPAAPSTETVPLAAALERVLARAMTSPLPVPAANNSAMDGYALRMADLSAEPAQCWPVVGQSLAGHPFHGEVPPGACIRITTGAVLPAGLDTVVMQEEVTREPAAAGGSTIRLHGRPEAGQHVRLQGSEIQPGQQVLAAGTVLGPLQLGLLATLGIAQVPVFRQVRVGVLSTGDELKQPGTALGAGDLYDSNRVVLCAVLQRLGCLVTDFGWVADDPAALRTLFVRAAGEVDVLVTSGGVSVGDADHVRAVLAELGQIGFWQVAIKPGKPFAFGALTGANGQQCWFFGLPGNPVSAVVTCEQLLVPALQQLQGQTRHSTTLWPATAALPLRKRPGRLDLQRVRLEVQADGVRATPVGLDSSAMLTSMLDADALLHLEQERGDVAAGEAIWLQPKSPWWR